MNENRGGEWSISGSGGGDNERKSGMTSFQVVMSICAVGLVLILGWALAVQPELERREDERLRIEQIERNRALTEELCPEGLLNCQ